MAVYKFRAECGLDAVHFFSLLDIARFENVHFYNMYIGKTILPDMEVQITCNYKLQELVRIANDDTFEGHVIAQTIKPVGDYTGERNIDL